MITKYTREAILADAARFTVKRDWKQQSYRFYKAAPCSARIFMLNA